MIATTNVIDLELAQRPQWAVCNVDLLYFTKKMKNKKKENHLFRFVPEGSVRSNVEKVFSSSFGVHE